MMTRPYIGFLPADSVSLAMSRKQQGAVTCHPTDFAIVAAAAPAHDLEVPPSKAGQGK